MNSIIIKDQSVIGKISNEFVMEIDLQVMSLKEIIRHRIYTEVEEHNQKMPDYFNGLIQPDEAEKVLNGYLLREKRQIDAEKQYFLALDAFQKNGYFTLVDNKQYDDLDELITLQLQSTVSFIKLTQLIGG